MNFTPQITTRLVSQEDGTKLKQDIIQLACQPQIDEALAIDQNEYMTYRDAHPALERDKEAFELQCRRLPPIEDPLHFEKLNAEQTAQRLRNQLDRYIQMLVLAQKIQPQAQKIQLAHKTAVAEYSSIKRNTNFVAHTTYDNAFLNSKEEIGSLGLKKEDWVCLKNAILDRVAKASQELNSIAKYYLQGEEPKRYWKPLEERVENTDSLKEVLDAYRTLNAAAFQGLDSAGFSINYKQASVPQIVYKGVSGIISFVSSTVARGVNTLFASGMEKWRKMREDNKEPDSPSPPPSPSQRPPSSGGVHFDFDSPPPADSQEDPTLVPVTPLPSLPARVAVHAQQPSNNPPGDAPVLIASGEGTPRSKPRGAEEEKKSNKSTLQPKKKKPVVQTTQS